MQNSDVVTPPPNSEEQARFIQSVIRCGLNVSILSRGKKANLSGCERQTIFLVEGDHPAGPAEFNQKSLRRVVHSCAAFVVTASASANGMGEYSLAALWALEKRRDVMFVAAGLRYEADWVNFLRKTNSSAPLLLITDKAMGGLS